MVGPVTDRHPEERLDMLDRVLIVMVAAVVVAGAAPLAARALPAPRGWPHPPVPAPGAAYAAPLEGAPSDAVQTYSNSDGVAPDETFVLYGRGLKTAAAWGPGVDASGQAVEPKVHVATGDLLVATLPDSAHDGLTLVWPGDGERWGAPIRLNAPDPWWVTPDRTPPAMPSAFSDAIWHVALIMPKRLSCCCVRVPAGAIGRVTHDERVPAAHCHSERSEESCSPPKWQDPSRRSG
jgi:hypothetical protein